MSPSPTRRALLKTAAAALAHNVSAGPASLLAQSPSVAHANVVDLDRATILSQAKAALAQPVQAPPGKIFFTETEPHVTTAGALPRPHLIRTDALALQSFSTTVAALSSGFLATHDDLYATRALAHTHAWLLAPATRLTPSFEKAGCAPGSDPASAIGTPMGVVDLVPLAELARSLSFLTDALTPDDAEALQSWFTSALQWLQTDKQAFIAREAKDRRASAWLLLAAAFARFLRDENTLEDCRKRFRSHTLRNQIRADGVFPQEVATPNPYRNTLFNFDMLAGACQLLSSQFDLLWDFELIDGVGLRIVAAYLYPVIAHPERWGYPADAEYFRDLPGRRPGLLFAGRAYSRPEYVETWHNTPAAAPPEALAYSFPITQPALWAARALHGL